MLFVRKLLALLIIGLVCLVPNAVADNTAIKLTLPTDAKPGTMVSTKSSNSSSGELTDLYNCARLKGAVVSGPTGSKTNLVAYAGTATVYVSDVNGGISPGDRIGCSSIAGVGAKLTSGQTIGEALAAFSLNGSATRTITASNGHQQTVHISSIPVLLQIESSDTASNPLGVKRSAAQRLADNLTGKQIADWRIAVAVLVIICAVILSGVMLFTGIRYTTIAIGRNPLAAQQTRASMRRVLISGIALLLAGLCVAYVILII